MRKSSAVMTFVVAASAITVGWRYADLEVAALNAPVVLEGLPTDTGTGAPVDPSASPTDSSTAAPTETSTASPTESSSGGSGGGSGSGSGGGSGSSGGSTAQPKPTQTQAPAPAPTEVTKASDTIDYKYGSISMSLTMLGDKIVSASITKGTTDFNGKLFKQWCGTLVNGGSYANTTGATYSFEAFKAAAQNVFGKF